MPENVVRKLRGAEYPALKSTLGETEDSRVDLRTQGVMQRVVKATPATILTDMRQEYPLDLFR
jgi:hypothetical protein